VIKWVRSPGLGLICIYDGPRRPGLAPWVPAFHIEEIRLLSSGKRKFVKLADWRAVCEAKRVFPEAYVIDVRKQRRPRRTQRMRLWPAPPFVPDDTDE
jgi:hypothetical protein